ncbi:MAG TPA: alcohol dehydrogenase catalytic domain-containing protein [Verrucomicrobiota bacterium]|nr:alcohol dehydrogenase catalytic domain-containing protein [Verrucomicrobiota bacterium]
MNAMVYRGVNDLRLEEVPVPRISPSELLVRVALCGVCPTDIKKIQHGTIAPPRIFGHETSGTIVRIGAKVRGFAVGDRVALHHHVPCLDCHFCRHRAFAQCSTYRRTGVTAGFEPAGGGFSEYVRVLSFCLPGVVKIPPRNSFVEGAWLEPVNTVLKGIRQLKLLVGDTVLVIGQGPIGLLFNRLLNHAGMRVVGSDLLPARRELGLRFGATKTVDATGPSWVDDLRRLTRGRGVDAVVITVPSDGAVTQGQQAVRGGGSVLLFAHTQFGHESRLDLARVCVEEKALLGSYSSDFTLQREVARLVFSRQLDVRPLVTHTFPLESAPEAIALVARAEPNALKVMVEPG